MRVTISIDDAIYKAALEMADSGMHEEDLFQEALKVFIRTQAGKRLADLGGETPLAEDICRRRSEPD
ncbi:Antitoxin VapB32 [Pseudomonas fluorescens]|uniref:Antitoxin VapB32 n=1 Tax=Pseudomonas fluorescens TaxID=294 RepID=A0A5E6S5W7_PSEFL|nr:Antitoxin VapB32 [Pseudomonas fluorescens]